MQLHGLLPTARIQLIDQKTSTCLVQLNYTNTLLPSNTRSIQICMLRIDMHMHTWSRPGRALILDGLCATLDYLSCAWRCGVSADSSHLPALLRVKQNYVAHRLFGSLSEATAHVACRFLLVSIMPVSIPVCVKSRMTLPSQPQ